MLLLSLPFTPSLLLLPLSLSRARSFALLPPPFSFPLAISFYLSSYLLLRLPPSPLDSCRTMRPIPPVDFHTFFSSGIVSSGRRGILERIHSTLDYPSLDSVPRFFSLSLSPFSFSFFGGTRGRARISPAACSKFKASSRIYSPAIWSERESGEEQRTGHFPRRGTRRARGE